MPEVPSPNPILVVDDNHRVTRALTKLLVGAGYAPFACHSGQEALAYAQGHVPAAAMVDIHLPDFSGLDLSAELRRRYGPAFPILILSGDTSMATLRSLPQAGATYFFAKPVHANSLLERLREWIDAPSENAA